ncbi:hypothetical protein Kisp01_69660 [Kineosporia sp. NBRC 101677]|nr:hypothetical protein Kisp01_69660 [Kineosporia sp. NBRC 101677]
MVHMRIGAALAAAMALGLAAGCSGSESPDSPPASSSSPTMSPVPSVSVDPEVQKALDAYDKFTRASNQAHEHPVAKGEVLPKSADFERWSFDPLRIETLAFVHALAAYRAQFRGEQPQSNVTVQQVNLGESPYPTVVLGDCVVPQGEYVPYSTVTDKKLRLTQGEDLEGPYLRTIEMIAVDGKWGARSVDVGDEGSCQP